MGTTNPKPPFGESIFKIISLWTSVKQVSLNQILLSRPNILGSREVKEWGIKPLLLVGVVLKYPFLVHPYKLLRNIVPKLAVYAL